MMTFVDIRFFSMEVRGGYSNDDLNKQFNNFGYNYNVSYLYVHVGGTTFIITWQHHKLLAQLS